MPDKPNGSPNTDRPGPEGERRFSLPNPNVRREVAEDGQLTEMAGGQRPSPDPAPRPEGPINRALETGGEVQFSESREGLMESLPDVHVPAPPDDSSPEGNKEAPKE